MAPDGTVDMRASRIANTIALATRVVKNLLVGSNLKSLRFLAKPRTHVEYVSECLLLRDSLLSKRQGAVQQKHVYEILPSRGAENIVLGNLSPEAEHWLWASYAIDIMSLCLICRIAEPKLVFEIGTLRGYTAYHFALNTPDDARIVTLDLATDQTSARKLKATVLDDAYVAKRQRIQRYDFDGTPVESKITCLEGDSATFDYSPYHGKVDLFFIDGAHSYQYVTSDSRQAFTCCHPGSIIVWHDFSRMGVEGVTRCVRELAREHAIYQVPGSSIAFMQVDGK